MLATREGALRLRTQEQVSAELERVRAERARRSLWEFVKEAWHVVEPATPFVPGWHLQAIVEHLEAITRGEIRNLVINVPPRHMKSLAVSVFWPTWEWIEQPWLRYIYSAYGEQLATRDALKSRRLIQSPWYQRHYGSSFRLTSDQNQKTRYDNDRTGYRIATGVGGMATGEGGDRLVLDDPHKLSDDHSDAAREFAIDFWNETMSTRGNDPETVAKVVIMQRVHERDVTGDIIEKMEAGGERYEMLVLPAEYEADRKIWPSAIGWEDPRREEGELLWPERFSREHQETLKVTLADKYPGQQQQRPAAKGGTVFKREWWAGKNRYDPASRRLKNKAIARFALWDTANKKKETNAYTALAVGELLPDYRLLLRYVNRKRLTFDELPDHIVEQVAPFYRDLKLKAVGIEDAASGQNVIPVLQVSDTEWIRDLIVPIPPVGKEESWDAASVWCRRDCVLLPEPTEDVGWLHDFEEELFKIPNAAFKDQADAFAMLVNHVERTYRALSTGWRARLAAAGKTEEGADGA
jgi:hypothetical protein